MKEPQQIIKRPLITEKSTRQKEKGNQIAFVVDPRANKIQVRQAVEKLFKVKVKSVHTLNLKGKRKRMGRFFGWRSDWKKAIVTLKEGERIEFFEGA
jgi:large subunit ribosomal protein L23